MRYKDERVPLATIAGELGVDIVVEGSVAQLNDGRLQVAVRLVNTETDWSLWGQTFVGAPREPDALQEAVASEVAKEVERLLEEPESGNAIPPPPR